METTSRDGGFVLNDTVNKFYDFLQEEFLEHWKSMLLM